jgi:hypothetical protein
LVRLKRVRDFPDTALRDAGRIHDIHRVSGRLRFQM